MKGFLFYRSIRRLFLILATPMFRFSVEGIENVPSEGPAIVVASHRSWLDPPCVGAAFPRPVRFLILEGVYRRPWARWFYRRMRSLPVNPSKRTSVVSLRRAFAHLRQGGVVGVFPEGRVVEDGSDVEFASGAAVLAVRTGAPVIPIVIHGSANAWPRGKRLPRPAPVRVRIEPPIDSSRSDGRDREAVERLMEQIRLTLSRLSSSAHVASERRL